MPRSTSRTRVQKIDEAKEIIADLEAKIEMQLSEPRNVLYKAGRHIDNERVYFEKIEAAMGETAGMAVQYGYDEVAADASQLVTDLQENSLNSD